MSERYDYEEAVKADVKTYLEEHLEKGEYITESKRQELYDDMFVSDSVTGNASGSYYCNSWKSEEAVCHNLDLLGEVLDEFGTPDNVAKVVDGEWADVSIRCLMLGRVYEEVMDEWNEHCENTEEEEDGEDEE